MSQTRKLYEQKREDVYCRRHTLDEEKGCLQCTPHLHREIEMVCFWGGRSIAYADSVRCELEPGDVYLAFPNQIHHYESFDKEDYHIFILNPELTPELADRFRLGIPASPVVKGIGNRPHVKETVEALYSACLQKNAPYGRTLVKGYLLALFSELLANMPISQLHVGDSSALRSIVSFCTENFTENLSLSMLEERLHLNKYYISHLFSGKLGLRFNDYVNSLRISEACRYLLNTDLSITEISEKVGFNTLRTFNRAFVKEVSVSPTEYRKRDAQKKEL